MIAVEQGDCLEWMAILPNRSVDHVITDPPYSEHTHRNGRRGDKTDVSRTRDLGFSSLSDDLRRQCAEEFSRVARRWVLVFCDDRLVGPWIDDLENAGLEFVRLGLWIKQGAAPQFTGDRPSQGHEAILVAHKPGRKRWNGGGSTAIWTVPIVGGTRYHTTQKPLALMTAMLRDFTEPGDLVLDPFAGSGTTLVAAKCLGRSAMGIELDAHYARVAQRRVAMAHEQLELVAPRVPRAKQIAIPGLEIET
jgi:site-specific DNA-methyltransferase (adenine-specific)